MGRRRRTAYWSTAGGAQVDDTHNLNQMQIPPAAPPSVEQPRINTRRSLRQHARKAATTSYAEDDFVDIEGSDEDVAQFAPPTPPRRKRFLKDTGSKLAKKEDVAESTAAVLNRLISKRAGASSSKPGYVVKKGRFNTHKGKAAVTNANASNINANAPVHPPKKRSVVVASTVDSAVYMPEQHMALPLKVEIQEGHGTVVHDGPKKRGRKRKVDQPVNLSMKPDPMGEAVPVQHHSKQDPDWDPNNENLHRKRGRQSAATANVKNRFPFCTLCLSKSAPSDYIINHMSCPTEYQKMKRLFTYIYKDLRFPFMPFDLERDDVFDYCDLPLCDCCIQLYREIYESYAKIEKSRDQLKSKIERMVYQIQLSEQNPAVAQQLGSIKNSPDALMKKYFNFRRRFASYRPGDSRGEVQGASLVPATIARIKVINQAPKRTTGCQTFLTAGHFPPPPAVPDLPQNATNTKATDSSDKASTSTTVASNSNTSKTSNASSSNAASAATVVVKKEVIEPEPPKPSSSSKQQNIVVNAKATKPSVVSKPSSKDKPPTKQTLKSAPAQQQASQVTASSKVQVPTKTTSTPPIKPVSKLPAPHSSVLTIVKSSEGGGPAIIRKLPPKKPCIIGQPARLLAIATPTHKTQGSNSKTVPPKTNVNGSTDKALPANSNKSTPIKQNSTSVPADVVKDEPIDAIPQPIEEEIDPFFANDLPTEKSNTETETASTQDKDDSTTEAEESTTKSKSDTNVFHKHKKLRVLPVPSYTCKESSNDSSDNNLASNEEDCKDKGDDKEKGDTEEEKEAPQQPKLMTEGIAKDDSVETVTETASSTSKDEETN